MKIVVISFFLLKTRRFKTARVECKTPPIPFDDHIVLSHFPSLRCKVIIIGDYK